ncbi:TIGR03089 family protein [Phytohabitans rumicis]|uniref:TIGR03089 family protein n=1 Tax=Phytohabitans rumicis TaxID=1076125 RepID=A0A6V8LHG5_9ACTN|nr:TIGR03089 family protein [Phytohabitans rumicis]GFJ94358.1 TIGR03089 family protein [Phytohabitans rumicis]
MLASLAVADPARPLLTYYDDATGERTEVSGVTLTNWVAKTANLLAACGLVAGDRAAVLLPPHWQTAAVLLGCWSAGVEVAFHSAATAGLPRIGPGADEPVGAVFAALDRVRDIIEDVPEADHRFVLGLGPMATPLREVPDGYLDYVAQVRGHADTFRPDAQVRYTDAATVDGTTYEEWGRGARGVAEAYDIRAGDRVLIDAARFEHPIQWLLAPLAAGATLVLCANLDAGALDARTRAEKVTRVLRG